MSGGGRLPIGVVGTDLGLLDRLQVDVLALGLFTEERPLRGAAGLCDWRLNGRLSAMVQRAVFGAATGETLLTDTNGRLGPARLLLFGLGPKARFDAKAFRHELRHMLVVAKRARFETLALEPPGRLAGPLPPGEALQVVAEVLRKAHPDARLTLLCPDKKTQEACSRAVQKDPGLNLTEPPLRTEADG